MQLLISIVYVLIKTFILLCYLSYELLIVCVFFIEMIKFVINIKFLKEKR